MGKLSKENMTALEKWKNDFKGFISELSMPEDDYKGILEYIDEVPNEALEQEPCECTEHPCLGKLCRYYKQPCEDCISRQADVLEKIRAEIEEHSYPIVHGVNNHEKGMTLYGILQIIDKYREVSE